MEYHGSSIAFERIEGRLMVNATQMGRSFGKTPKDWLRTQQANDLIQTVSVRHNCLTADLQLVRQGGTPHLQGTWFHEDVALFFAQWLSPEFYLMCNDKLRQLLLNDGGGMRGMDWNDLRHNARTMHPNGIECWHYKDLMRYLGYKGSNMNSRTRHRYAHLIHNMHGHLYVTREFVMMKVRYRQMREQYDTARSARGLAQLDLFHQNK